MEERHKSNSYSKNPITNRETVPIQYESARLKADRRLSHTLVAVW